MAGMDNPVVHEYRNARAELLQGLRAPAGARERYRQAIGPYLAFCADFCPVDSPARKHYMAALAYADDEGPGLPLVAILAAFRATADEAEWIRAQKPEFAPEPVDERDRLSRLPYGVYLRTDHWKRVRQAALERAEHRCQLCNTEVGIEVHHRSYTRKGAERPADVVALCSDCHGRHHREIEAA